MRETLDRVEIQQCEGMGDWFVIQRSDVPRRLYMERTGPGMMALRDTTRISDADVEGTGGEMRALAAAIRNRTDEEFRRCAVRVEGDRVAFWSPRNSMAPGYVTLAAADALAEQIDALFAPTLPTR